MNSPDSLFQATVNTLTLRLTKRLSKMADNFSATVDDAPQRLREEWDLFQKEVIDEADRLDRQNSDQVDEVRVQSQDEVVDEPRQTILQIRKKVSDLNQKFEAWL